MNHLARESRRCSALCLMPRQPPSGCVPPAHRPSDIPDLPSEVLHHHGRGREPRGVADNRGVIEEVLLGSAGPDIHPEVIMDHAPAPDGAEGLYHIPWALAPQQLAG